MRLNPHETPQSQFKRSDRTQSARAPEEETRRYVEIAEHFWVIVKKESNSFSALVLWCSVFYPSRFLGLIDVNAFKREQGTFAGQPQTKTTNAGARDDAMTWDDDGDRITSDSATDGA
jgi:hypothetical protein